MQDFEIENNCYVNDRFIGTVVAKKIIANVLNDGAYNFENKEISVKTSIKHYDKEETKEGEEIALENIKAISARIGITGKTEQEQSIKPTPSSPSEIKNITGNIEIKIRKKNMINHNELITGYTLTDTGTTTANANYMITNYIEVEGNKNYVSSENQTIETSGTNIRCCCYDKDKKFISRLFSSNRTEIKRYTHSFTAPQNAKYICLSFRKTDTECQLEQGLEATDYEPYKEQITTFPLAEGQRLYEGSYLADDGIHHIKNQIIFTGTEAWSYANPTWAYIDIPDILPQNELSDAYCNIALEKISSSAYTSTEFCFATTETKRIAFKSIGYNALNEWKTFLTEKYSNGTPVIVEYKLEKEKIVAYTEEQEEAWRKLKAVMLYEGYNHICSTNDLRAIISITYGTEEIPLGNYIIPKPETEEVTAQSNIVGYDYMKKFEKLYVDNNIYPISLENYLNNLCQQVGVQKGTFEMINGTYMIQGNPFTNNEDCKTVLSNIAQLACGFAQIGFDNKLYIISLDKNAVIEESIDGNNYTNFKANNIFGPVNSVCIKMNSNVEGEESVREEEGITEETRCQITIADNYFLADVEQREMVIDEIYNSIKGVTYLPCNFDYYGYPWLTLGTKIKILDTKDVEYETYLLNHRVKYNGGYEGNIENPALTKTQSAYKNTIDIKTWKRRTELKVDKIEGEIIQVVEEVTEQGEKLSQQEQDIEGIRTKVSSVETTVEEVEDMSKETADQLASLGETVTVEGTDLEIDTCTSPVKIDIWARETIVEGTPSIEEPANIITNNEDIKIIARSKNIFNINRINEALFGGAKPNEYHGINGTQITIHGNSADTLGYGYKIDGVKSNTNYTISCEVVRLATNAEGNINSTIHIGFSEENPYENKQRIIITEIGRINQTINTGEYTNILIFFNNSGSYIQGAVIKNLQIEQGETATEYEECREKQFLFPLNEEELCNFANRNIDRLTDLGISKAIGKRVLTGTENWLGNYASDSGNTAQFPLSIPDMSIGDIYWSRSPVKSDKFTSSIWGQTTDTEKIYSQPNMPTLYIKINKSRMANYSVEDTPEVKAQKFKDWLSANNVTVYYEKNEETKPYTPTQQDIYNQLQNLVLTQGYNHIICVNENKPNMKITYYPNISANEAYVSKYEFENVTKQMSAEINIKANEVETSVQENTTAHVLTLLNNGYLTAEQVQALVDGNTEEIATIKNQLTQTVTSDMVQIIISEALEGGITYLKNTLFTINNEGMWIATSADEFNALYNNTGMYLYSYDEMIAKYDKDGAVLKNLKVEGEIETKNLRIMDVVINEENRTHIHWIGG